MYDEEEITRKQQDLIEFYSKLDYLYEMLVNSKEIPDDFSSLRFDDGTKISYWLSSNLYKLENLKNKNNKAKDILLKLRTRNNKGKANKKYNYEKVFNSKLKEVYEYYLKTVIIPNHNSNVLFEDGTNMYNWIINHKNKLYEIRDKNFIANVILTECEKRDTPETIFNDKLKEAYQYYIKYNTLPDDTLVVLFSDGNSMNNWLRVHKKQLQQIRNENFMADIVLNVIETTKFRKKTSNLNQKVNELYSYCKKTKDILMSDENMSFLDGTKYATWFNNNISRIRKLRKLNNKAYMLVLAHDFNQSLIYNKSLLEIYTYCMTTNSIPDTNIKQKLTNGYNMGGWLRTNKYLIWRERKTNPYCMQLVKAMLKIRPRCFNYYISSEDEKITVDDQTKVLFKIRK